MEEHDWLAKRFQDDRTRLQAVAYRMLGSRGEADDAVQEAWIRLSRSDAAAIENLGGWLTTVVARVCLDMLRSRKSRSEQPLDGPRGQPAERVVDAGDLEAEVLLADSLGPALLVVLSTLTPAERVAFVLHDMFDLSFQAIAAIVGRSEAATRQLASRARRRVRGASGAEETNEARQRELVTAFLAAARGGDLEALVGLLAPDVVLRADDVAVSTSASLRDRGAPALASELRGARAVAGTFETGARGARLARLDGLPGAVWAPGGKPRAAFVFVVEDGRITEIEVLMAPAQLETMEIEIVRS